MGRGPLEENHRSCKHQELIGSPCVSLRERLIDLRHQFTGVFETLEDKFATPAFASSGRRHPSEFDSRRE